MKFVTFEIGTPLGPVQRLGALQGESVIDLNLAYRADLQTSGRTGRAASVADTLLPSDLLAFLETGRVAEEALAEATRYVGELEGAGHPLVGPGGERLVLPLSEVRLRAPLLRPRSLREFSLFEGHIGRKGQRQLPDVWYEMPLYWKGNPNAMSGPDDVILWPSYTERLDFELEIAAVIGRPGINIPPERAIEHIAGFTIFNDVSARDIQAREMKFMLGPAKGKDFCNVMGPALVTPDEIDPLNLRVKVRVNGEQWADSSTDDMRFGWGKVIAHVSQDEWLLPGDVLTAGTVTDCSAFERSGWAASGPLLHPGDELELEVEGIGVLRNRVAEKP